MRRYWFVIAALIAALVTGLAPVYAATGGGVPGSGCSAYCGKASDGSGYCIYEVAGDMATCENVQWCYREYGGGMHCEKPSCDGTYCMFF